MEDIVEEDFFSNQEHVVSWKIIKFQTEVRFCRRVDSKLSSPFISKFIHAICCHQRGDFICGMDGGIEFFIPSNIF